MYGKAITIICISWLLSNIGGFCDLIYLIYHILLGVFRFCFLLKIDILWRAKPANTAINRKWYSRGRPCHHCPGSTSGLRGYTWLRLAANYKEQFWGIRWDQHRDGVPRGKCDAYKGNERWNFYPLWSWLCSNTGRQSMLWVMGFPHNHLKRYCINLTSWLFI